jgi:serine/threonine protein kinase
LKSKEGDTLTTEQLLQWTLSAAHSVGVMNQKGIIHRDIAARNFLLTNDLQLKMSDFGMSKLNEIYYAGSGRDAQIPVRWSAPEILTRQRYSMESDLYALGVTLWEIFTRFNNLFSLI